MTTASAYIENNRLHLLGSMSTDNGIVPFSHCVELAEEVPDGPVNIGADDLPPAVSLALIEAKPEIQSKINGKKLKLIVENLIERSRLRDQNAIAMLIQIRKNAAAGVPRAKAAFVACKEYLSQHPMTDTFEGEPEGSLLEEPSQLKLLGNGIIESPSLDHYAAVISALYLGDSFQDSENVATVLANGPEITADAVKKILEMIEEKRLFLVGLRSDENTIANAASQVGYEGKKALQLGYAVGLGKRLQMVRKPDSIVARFSEDAAWELGE
jgi:hypothetical protein